MKARVFVTLKREVLDPQGKAVERSLASLGFDHVRSVRVGKLIELTLDETDAERAERSVRSMCDKLLANGVIEDASVEILG